jgi:hypothetical protein
VFVVDPSVTSGLASYLNTGKSISIVCDRTTWNTKAAITSTGTFSLPIQRGFSILSGLRFSLYTGKAGTKEVTCLQHPLYGEVPDSTTDQFAWSVAVGGTRWPTQDCVGVAEAWYRTRMALSLFMGSKEIGITPHAFRSESGVFCVNMARVIEDENIAHSGISTLNGANLVLHLKNLPAPIAIEGQEQPRTIFVSCIYDSIFSISQEGVRVYS